ncbi:MAG: type II toxin-antitoxin system VapC family toxin [Bacillota bacterium]
MILVDTSVLIDFLKGRSTAKTASFREVLLRDVPFGFSVFTYQEVLQGSRDEAEYARLKAYMSTQKIYCVPDEVSVYERAARMYFDLRRKGVTVRSTIDVLIALTAIDNHLYLLHDDNDFDVMARHVPELEILTAL